MPDPVQVVAEARGSHHLVVGSCRCGEAFVHPLFHTTARFENHVNEAIVAALQAAGALMPEEAGAVRDDAARMRSDYGGATRLAWRLYLAATQQSNDTFEGVQDDPVTEVERYVSSLSDQLINRDALLQEVREKLEALPLTDVAPLVQQIDAVLGQAVSS